VKVRIVLESNENTVGGAALIHIEARAPGRLIAHADGPSIKEAVQKLV